VCDERLCDICEENMCKMNEHSDRITDPDEAVQTCFYCSQTGDWINHILNLTDPSEIRNELIKLCRAVKGRGFF
jgi:hypothetical protein